MAGSGVQRAVRFTQYFASSPLQPLILTTTRWGNDLENPDWEKQLPPGLKIGRVFSLDPFRFIQALRNRRKLQANSVSSVPANAGGLFSLLKTVRSLMHKISIPDQAIWWAPAAVLMGFFLIVKYKPALIFSTSGPYGTSLAALLLHLFTGIKWAAEFRDPWAANKLLSQQGLRHKIEAWQERMCLKSAAAVVCTTEATAAEYKARTPRNGCSEFITVTNGFHPPDFISLPLPAKKEVFQVVYTGMFYGTHTPECLFKGIKKACGLNAEFSRKVRFVFAGSMPSYIKQKAAEPPLDQMITILPYVSHREVLDLLASADMLYLALAPQQGDIYPGKIFEYLAARKFIFSTVPPGITADTLNRFHAGFVVHPQDIDAIAQKLLEAYHLFLQNRLQVSHSLEELQEFSWQRLAEKLYLLFQRILSEGNP